ncbi:MAG: prephenate dehydratase [Gammaproteobacteria bacterium]|nr:prephenate dehydratase [Gammaproteobacteria bacterium]
MNELDTLRKKIDQLDSDIQRLINERAQCAQVIGQIKHQAGDGNFYKPEREAQVLRAVQERNQGPLPADVMARLFREIMSACLALEQPLRVAYLGPEGTFTQLAALKHFGQSVTAVPLNAIDEVFREVQAGSAAYGVVPVENSTEGAVTHTLDMFLQSPLRVCGEVLLRVHHNVLSTADQLTAIKTIYAHQQALAQCREWLNTHLPQAERVAVASNAEAARLAAKNSATAALGSTHAATIYALNILANNVEDEPDNTTRFLVIGQQTIAESGDDKTSLMVSTKNKSGALYSLLKPLADHECSMTRIESRPSRQGAWEYVFFIDIEGHHESSVLQRALRALEKEAAMVKVLGSYPKAAL